MTLVADFVVEDVWHTIVYNPFQIDVQQQCVEGKLFGCAQTESFHTDLYVKMSNISRFLTLLLSFTLALPLCPLFRGLLGLRWTRILLRHKHLDTYFFISNFTEYPSSFTVHG